MKIFLLATVFSFPALALSPDAQEFMSITRELEPRLSKAGDAEDLAAISRQQREAFYRCE